MGRGVVAVDGKTMRGSANARHGAYHVVSAFAAENQLVLGEVCVAEKSNEIEAVPELLDMIDVSGAVVGSFRPCGNAGKRAEKPDIS